MSLSSKDLLKKAQESLDAARLLLEEGFVDIAAGRAYFTMFYVAQAFLLTDDLSFSKHSAVIAAFGRDFVKTGKIDSRFHRYLIDAQEIRLIADYRGEELSADEAQLQIDRAEEFLNLATQLPHME